jgi:hypothetical protein
LSDHILIDAAENRGRQRVKRRIAESGETTFFFVLPINVKRGGTKFMIICGMAVIACLAAMIAASTRSVAVTAVTAGSVV